MSYRGAFTDAIQIIHSKNVLKIGQSAVNCNDELGRWQIPDLLEKRGNVGRVGVETQPSVFGPGGMALS